MFATRPKVGKRDTEPFLWLSHYRLIAFPFSAISLTVLILIGASSCGSSGSARGSELLRELFPHSRPLKTRLSVFPQYLHFSQSRGRDVEERRSDFARVERVLSADIGESRDPKAHQVLAILFTVEGRLTEARSELRTALEQSSEDAQFFNDTGALFLEFATSIDRSSNGAQQLFFLNESLQYLDRSLEIDPNNSAALFNKAICLEILNANESAKAVWSNYLLLDHNSEWGDEARRHLESLNKKSRPELNAEQLEAEVFAAVANNDRSTVSTLVSQNRELIRDKYLPHRFAYNYLRADEAMRPHVLQAIKMIGDVEAANSGDRFAAEIAEFYSRLQRNREPELLLAHRLNREGISDCLKQTYAEAVPKFLRAKDIFTRVGSANEAEISLYFASYARFNSKDVAAAKLDLSSIVDRSRARGYKWLEATALHWIGNICTVEREPSSAIDLHERASDLAKQVGDLYSQQRNLMAIASINSSLGLFSESLRMLPDMLSMNGNGVGSIRQQYRSLSEANRIISRSKLYFVALAIANESSVLAVTLGDEFFLAQSKAHSGEAFGKVGKYERAYSQFDEARDHAHRLGGDAETRLNAFIDMKHGAVALEQGDFAAAEVRFRIASDYYTNIEFYFNSEEARRGLMMAYLGQGALDSLEEQIPINIRLSEEYRGRTSDRTQRESYLNSSRSIYDIASEFEFVRGDIARAYDYKELASSRSLYETLSHGSGKPENYAAALISGPSQPMKIDEIRQQLDADVQIIQYGMFDRRLVIWLVSRERLIAKEVQIDAKRLGQLSDRLIEEASAVQINKPDSWKESARELYEILVAPIRSELDPNRPLVIIPDRSLFKVPFGVLLGQEGRPMVQEFAMVYASSANVYLSSTGFARQRGSAANELVTTFGDPTFDRGKHPNLAPLPDSADEAKAVREEYSGGVAHIGKQASVRSFLDSIVESDVIHFAGHYVAVPESPLSSYLVLAPDAKISDNGEVTNAKLSTIVSTRVRLIVIAACSSGIESYAASEGLEGLSRTFIGTKVPLVVASRWPVDSAATSELMKAFHRNRARLKMTSVEALRQAQIAMYQGQNRTLNHPFYWAAFSVFGGSARF